MVLELQLDPWEAFVLLAPAAKKQKQKQAFALCSQWFSLISTYQYAIGIDSPSGRHGGVKRVP